MKLQHLLMPVSLLLQPACSKLDTGWRELRADVVVASPAAAGERAARVDAYVEGLYAARGAPIERDEHGQMRGVSVGRADIELFLRSCALLRPKRIFGVGNAFGFSSVALAVACGAPVDVIEAEVLDMAREGTLLTRRIAEEEKLAIRVFVGFSPMDTAGALREWGNGTYDLAFIDGKHTNRALVADYLAIRRAMAPRSICILHDVQNADLWRGVLHILRADPRATFRMFEGTWPNLMGTGILHWGIDDPLLASLGPRLSQEELLERAGKAAEFSHRIQRMIDSYYE